MLTPGMQVTTKNGYHGEVTSIDGHHRIWKLDRKTDKLKLTIKFIENSPCPVRVRIFDAPHGPVDIYVDREGRHPKAKHPHDMGQMWSLKLK